MTSTSDQPAAAAPAAANAPQEWKPEPRQWTWKDLFTAPMLAFKPKCMLISALTLVALGLWAWSFPHIFDALSDTRVEGFWYHLMLFIWITVGVVVYSIGATLVSVFMRADLLDDEFLSLGEAFGQFKGRLVPAVLVPLVLLLLVVGVNVGLIYLPELFCSIPYVGGAVYAVFYPIAYFLAIFAVLLGIAVLLSLFVFPGIIAIRKHGWFDNVVDTIEAVGTKPHVLVASLILTMVMINVSFFIGMSGMNYLKGPTNLDLLPGHNPEQELRRVEERASEVRYSMLSKYEPIQYLGKFYGSWDRDYRSTPMLREPYRMPILTRSGTDGRNTDFKSSYYYYGPGLVAGIWQGLILSVLLGYCMNLLIGGGMLTYLLVREDDYWDDEDLEDLDKLAKELEEEAKREEAGTPASPANAPAPTAPSADKPAPPSA
ncbi:MAG: hypothetical protein H0W83_05670 [Planctomycetes bacterium]|nr:hypothetical protein [Planctomycetota bacterium]